jgi:hypothetical protein
VSLRGVRVWIAPWLFRLPWFRRFDGYAAHWTILLRSHALLADGDLAQHEPIRRSRDTTAWGDQQALYASTDPVWAIYFACLRRDDGFRGTRNGTLGEAGGPLYPRSYFFVHNRGSASPHRFGPGTLYVLPAKPFAVAPPLAGVVDTAHLVSKEAVTPLARVDVTPADFPFAGRIGYYRDREPIFVTLLRG